VHVSEHTRTPPSFPASPETLIQLEFPRALDEVAARAVGPLGAAAVRGRLPSSDRETVRQDLATVTELQGLLAAGDPFRPEPIEDVTPILAAVRIPGTVLDPADLVELGRAFEAMRIVRVELGRLDDRAPRTAALAVATPPPALGRELLETFEPDGAVRDGADAGVDRARRKVRDARSRLLQALERTLRGLAAHEASPDAAVTVRSGRYVIPVHADARGRVPGIVHGESASGATLFVEPQDAVELGNQLAAAEADESRAVHAVLRRLSDAVRPHVDAAGDGLAMCVAADDLYARARYAADVDGHAPRLGLPGEAHVLWRCRHPLLLAEGVDAVPFDLDLAPDELALIVSGPNTGGKTVLLKAVGLVNALAQSGVVPPVGERSALPAYTTIVTDIGDHQSIAANLSTFSAHVAALRRALDQAGPGTLVLLDEVGSGTDPAEGAALAAAVLQELVTRRARTVATTHLGALKQLAAETSGVVNASLHFDAAALTPTYELAKGIPGRSYGLAIARRLGIPADVVAAAEARRPAAERTLEAVLADVERRTADLSAREAVVAERETDAETREARAARLQADAETRDAEVRERQTTLEREGREQARCFLLEARKRVDDALGVARAAVSEATAREARRLVEQGISQEGIQIQRLEEALAQKGWRVRGKMEPTPSSRPHVLTSSRPHVPTSSRSQTPQSPTTPSEIDLRGMTGDEARDAVIRAVDDAVLADLPAVRIIHGKGTGVLRRVVDEVLRADRRVSGRRLAPPREGGTGVTIAELAG
jgi:DNA mismatch repair protein MutS2